MNFGYLLVVSKSEKADYLKMAYALAISIKNTQKPGYDKVALVIDDASEVDSLKSPWVFDHVIEWNQETYWNGRSWMDQLTPFEHTVCLDVDMLFFRDHSHWIDYFVESETELFMPSTVYTYRGAVAVDDFYRKAFRENGLPNVYSFFTFFKKDATITKNFFELNRQIMKHPDEFNNVFLTRYRPKEVGTDEAFALAAKILGIEEQVAYPLHFPKVVHLKPMIQGWPWPTESVSAHVGFYFDKNCQLKIGNFQQEDAVHYNDKEFVTDEIVSILEEKLWNK